MRRYLISLVILFTACTTSPPGSGDASTADLLEPADGPAGKDGAAGACAGLGECECRAHGDTCQVIAEPCWCPFPQCGSGNCLCGGGKFLGCAPLSSHCAGSISCLPAGRPSPPDDKGCISCAYQSDCQKAFDEMVGTCAGKKGLLGAFSCSKNPECVTKCINSLARCDDIGCGLCGACGCAVNGPFEQCFFQCVQ